jgi:hypothetical protein
MDPALSISSPCLSMSACPAPACFRQRHLRREVIFQADPFDVPHHRPPIARHASSAAPGHHCDPHRLGNSRVRRRAAVEPTGPFTGHPASALRRSADVLPRRPRLLQPRVPQCSWARGPAQHPRRCSRIAGCDLGKCAGLRLVIMSGGSQPTLHACHDCSCFFSRRPPVLCQEPGTQPIHVRCSSRHAAVCAGLSQLSFPWNVGREIAV